MTGRQRIAALGALCVALLPAAGALAHNGIGAAFKGQAGRYIVYAYDGDALPDGTIDNKVVLLNGRTKNPVYDTKATISATGPGVPTARAKITTFGNVVFYNLPNPYPHAWTVHLRLSGRLGTGQARYRMHGALTPSSDPAPIVTVEPGSTRWPIIVGAAVGGLAVVGGVFYLLRRSASRRRA